MTYHLPDGHEVHEHECPGCGRVIYTRRRRCSTCHLEREDRLADYLDEQRRDRG